MEKNILLSGLSYSKENFELMRKTLIENGISDIIDFGSYNKYTNMSNIELIKLICENFEQLAGSYDVNIICHSMGCNIGLILAKEKSDQIKKAIFLSPELQKTTRKEKKIAKLRIMHGVTDTTIAEDKSEFPKSKPIYDLTYEQPVKLGIFDKIALFKVFCQTKKIAIENLNKIENLDSYIAYGVADKFVSQKGAEELARQLDGEIAQIRTRHHNLLLSSRKDETARQITKFLQK